MTLGRGPAIAIALLALPRPALAHGSVAGIGGFGAGLIHPALVPEHALVLVGLGLWLGQQDLPRTGRPILAFATLLTAGLAASPLGAAGPVAGAILLLMAAGLGLVVASAWNPSSRLAAGLCGAAALALGLDSAPDAGQPGIAVVTLAGTWIGAHLILLEVLAVTTLARRAWMRIGVRVLGSWTAASALMVLALVLA